MYTAKRTANETNQSQNFLTLQPFDSVWVQAKRFQAILRLHVAHEGVRSKWVYHKQTIVLRFAGVSTPRWGPYGRTMECDVRSEQSLAAFRVEHSDGRKQIWNQNVSSETTKQDPDNGTVHGR
jgi:hypothetical protein